MFSTQDSDISRVTARALLSKYDDEPPASGPRYNPLKGFERYREGYDPYSEDYWASTIFTGVIGFAFGAMAVLWLILVVTRSVFKTCGCYSQGAKKVYQPMPTLLQRAALVLWTGAVLIGAALLFSSSPTVPSNLDKVAGLLSDATEDVLADLETVTLSFEDALDALSFDFVQEDILREDIVELKEEAADISDRVNDYSDTIEDAATRLQFCLVIASAVLAGVVLAGLVSGCCGWSRLLYATILTGVLFAVLAWTAVGIITGITTFFMDSCDQVHDKLSGADDIHYKDIFDCPDSGEVDTLLIKGQDLDYDLGTEANAAIATIDPAHLSIQKVCLRNETDCIPTKYASMYYESKTCLVSAPPCLDPSKAEEIILKADAMDGLRRTESILENLSACSYVDETFEEIEEEHCNKGLLPSMRLVWAALNILAAGTTASAVTWQAVIYHAAD